MINIFFNHSLAYSIFFFFLYTYYLYSYTMNNHYFLMNCSTLSKFIYFTHLFTTSHVRHSVSQATLQWGNKKDEPVYVTEESGVVGLMFHQSKEILIQDRINGHYDVRAHTTLSIHSKDFLSSTFFWLKKKGCLSYLLAGYFSIFF